MLQLEPFTEDQGRPAVITRSSASLRLPGFSTRRLARMSDSLVRVSRRVGGELTGRCARIAVPLGTQKSARGVDGRTDGIIQVKPGLVPPAQPASVHASRGQARWSAGSEPNRVRPRRIANPHPLPSRQFQALFDSLSVSYTHLTLPTNREV